MVTIKAYDLILYSTDITFIHPCLKASIMIIVENDDAQFQ